MPSTQAAHSVGMQKDTSLNGLVRLAIPIGMKSDDVRAFGDRLVAAFADRRDIPDLVAADRAGERPGDLNAKYRLGRLLMASAPMAATKRPASEPSPAGDPVPAAVESAAVAERKTHRVPEQDIEIAIVGMAARFPQATNAEELWENLAQGRDCITEIPPSRYSRRRNRKALGKYRGGFIDDIDRRHAVDKVL